MEAVENSLDGLLKELPMSSTGVKTVNTILWQVIHALTAAEHVLKLHHGDLHTFNIMYSRVDAEEVHYVIGSRTWKIHNGGICVKLIDFGHAWSDLVVTRAPAGRCADLQYLLNRLVWMYEKTSPELHTRVTDALTHFDSIHEQLLPMLDWWGTTSGFVFSDDADARSSERGGCLRTPQVYTIDGPLEATHATALTPTEAHHAAALIKQVDADFGGTRRGARAFV